MKRIIAFLLLAFVLATALASCEEAGVNESSLSSETEEESISEVSRSEYQNEKGEYVGKTSGKRYDGMTITFLTCGETQTYESEIVENIDTYENGARQTYPQMINDDLRIRAEILERELGLTLEEIQVYSPTRKNGEMFQEVVRGNLSSTQDYQIVVPCLYDGASLAVAGHLYNLLSLDGLQLSAPWWNQEFNESMTYAGQLYFTVGDIGLVNKANTAALFFNYELWDKYGLDEKYGGTPYDLVREGKWTSDLVFEAARAMNDDKNGDGIVDYRDEFGWSGQLDDMWSIFFGSGEKIASADGNGYPTITMYNERSAKVMERLQEFMQSDEHVSANDYFNVTSSPVDLTRGAFIDGRALFFNDVVGTVARLGDMEQHFGVVPEPKYDVNQADYYSLVNPWGSTCFAIPTSVSKDKLEMVVDALNVLGASSKNTIAKDYQETVLTYMKTRDDESAEMINDYILPTRACDIGMVYQWGGLDILLQEMAAKTVGTFASEFEKKQSSAETALQNTLDFYKKHEN